jgi:hypothetical protein
VALAAVQFLERLERNQVRPARRRWDGRLTGTEVTLYYGCSGKMLNDDMIGKACDEVESRFQELSNAEQNSEQPPPLLHHYTSAEGLLGIVQTRQLWATNAFYLNDTSEVSDALGFFRSELESLKLGEHASLSCQNIWLHSKDVPLDHFIVSFCKDGDLLGQWRRYGSRGTGYSIGFHTSALLAAAQRERNSFQGGCTLRRVKYLPDQKVEMMRKRVEILRGILEPLRDELEFKDEDGYRRLIRLWVQINASLHPTLALMKHYTFESEEEWRLVRTLWRKPVPTVEWSVQVRMIGGKLAPYIPISWVLPNSPESGEVRGVSEVHCGPSADPELKEKVVRDLLIAQNCLGARVVRSAVPLRA